MKSMKFLALSLLAIASTASAKINFSSSVVRGETLNLGSQLILDLNQREMSYKDETVYIESELLEETAESVVLQFTIATKNENGAFIVRGLPKLSFAMNPETKVMSGSLLCDGPSETFTLLVSIEKIEEASALVAQPAE